MTRDEIIRKAREIDSLKLEVRELRDRLQGRIYE